MKCTAASKTQAPFGKRWLDRTITTRELIFLLAVVFCLSPLITPPIALLLGLIVAQFVGHPYLHLNHKATHILLQVSVVGLGFGMNISNALQTGKAGILFTVVSIAATLLIGLVMGKLLSVDKTIAYLVSVGTAICGGSAIAAISPVIKAEEKKISVALGTIFILNAVALVVFPVVGHGLHLSQTQFGWWCAIAIHDTSSVVGAAGRYGTHALEIATTVKLLRALWIIPVTILSAIIFKNKNAKIKIPYFIGLFVVAMLMNSYVPFIATLSHTITNFAKAILTLTLFLIGCGLSTKTFQSVGLKPFVQGVVLWLIVSAVALLAIVSFVQ